MCANVHSFCSYKHTHSPHILCSKAMAHCYSTIVSWLVDCLVGLALHFDDKNTRIAGTSRLCGLRDINSFRRFKGEIKAIHQIFF